MTTFNRFNIQKKRHYCLYTQLAYNLEDKMQKLDRSWRLNLNRNPTRIFNQTARQTCYSLFYPNKLSYLRWHKPHRYVSSESFNVSLAKQVGYPLHLANSVSCSVIFEFALEKN